MAAIAHHRLAGWGVEQEDDGTTITTGWRNDTAGDVEVTWCRLGLHFPSLGLHWIDGPHTDRTVRVPAGSLLAIDAVSFNSPAVTLACLAAGLVEA